MVLQWYAGVIEDGLGRHFCKGRQKFIIAIVIPWKHQRLCSDSRDGFVFVHHCICLILQSIFRCSLQDCGDMLKASLAFEASVYSYVLMCSSRLACRSVCYDEHRLSIISCELITPIVGFSFRGVALEDAFVQKGVA